MTYFHHLQKPCDTSISHFFFLPDDQSKAVEIKKLMKPMDTRDEQDCYLLQKSSAFLYFMACEKSCS